MGSGDDKRKRKGPDFTIDNTVGGPLEDKPMVVKISSPRGTTRGTTQGTNRSSAINRRAFLKGTLTAGAGLAGIAGVVGSSGSDQKDDDNTGTPPPGNDNANSPGYERQCSYEYHPSHAGNISAVDFDNTGRRVVSAGQDDGKATAKVWDTETGDLLLTYAGHHSNQCTCAAFSPDSTRIATSGFEETLHIWDAATGERIIDYAFNTDYCRDLAFSPDGKKIAVFGAGPEDLIIDAHSGTLLITHTGHTGHALCGAYSPDGTRIVSSDMDNPLRLWDATTGDLIRTYDGHSGEVLDVVFSPDGTKVASCGPGADGVHIWECDTGNLVTRYTGHENYPPYIHCIAFHPDGRVLATGDWNRIIDIWESASAERLVQYFGHGKSIASLSYSPDGTRIASGSEDKFVHIWSAGDGTMESKLVDKTVQTMDGKIDCSSEVGGSTNVGCSCNTVCTCDTVCTCNSVCSCDSYSGGGGGGGIHYWHPN